MFAGALLAVLLGAQGAASLSLHHRDSSRDCQLPTCAEATPACAGRVPKCFSQEGRGPNISEPGCASFLADCQEPLCTSQDYVCHREGNATCNTLRQLCGSLAAAASERGHLVAIAGPLADAQELPMFIHIPKNGGTTIEESGFRVGALWGRHHEALFGMTKMPTGSECNGWHVPPALWGDNMSNPYMNQDTFCVVRNPYDRMVSEYEFLRINPYSGEMTQKWMVWGEHRGCNAEDLNNFVQWTLKVAMETDKYVMDCHMLPQSTYIWSDGREWCKNVIRMENFAEGMEALRSHPKLANMTLEPENEHPKDCNLTAADLNESTKAMMARWYAEDFKRFGFEI